jgi:uncharacterized membrane protein
MSVSSVYAAEERRAKRFMLLSLAFNLFFIAVAGTLIARAYFSPPLPVSVTIDRRAGARIERIAATLPKSDAEIMRAAYRDNAAKLDAARDEFENALAVIKTSFRAEPYDVEATKKEMAETREKQQVFIALLHDAIASAAAKMSPAGRVKLAEYSSARVTIRPDR